MEKGIHFPEKFSTLEEERRYLQERIAEREWDYTREHKDAPENVAREEVKHYASKSGEEMLAPDYLVSKQDSRAITLELSPEPHDEKISGLLGMLLEKGIYNTLSVVEQMHDPHLADDFHRFLVQYIKTGRAIEKLKEKDPLARELRMSLFEILLPEASEKSEKGEQEKTLKDLVSRMAQFYAGMLSVASEGGGTGNVFSLEIAVANHSDEFIFYCAIPDSKKNLFEKQIFSIFPNAKINEQKNDYNIFNEGGGTVASYAKLKENSIYPLKNIENFSADPINTILNSFSKIKRDGEGAAIQIIFNPVGNYYLEKYKYALEEIRKGKPLKEAIDIPLTITGQAGKIVKELFKTATTKPKEHEKKDTPPQIAPREEAALKEITDKILSPILPVNIRIIASAESVETAEAIRADIESAFNQFENTSGNRFGFEHPSKKTLEKLFEEFTYRTYTESERCLLSLNELAGVMHLPASEKLPTGQVKLSKAGTAPAPLDLPQDGTLLGTNNDRGKETKIYMTNEDRLRHFYVIGQTGTGKTALLKNMILQDIRHGDGVCFIDPHGSDVEEVLGLVPSERAEDVIYFDPAYTDRPMGLNMLEFDPRFPEQKTFVVNEMLSIFNKLFDMKTAGGPMFEQYFRNAVLLTLEDIASGSTLLDVSRVLSDEVFRNMKLSRAKNPLVIQFWRQIAEKAGGEGALQNIVPYVVSKFDNFLANDFMRPIIAQEKSAFNFREIMDERKILLVNLSKGRLGDINANLLGLIIVGKLLMSALSRVDSLGRDLPPFYLYVDEFQNITTDSISTIFSEARKYKLSLTVAHQFIAQLEENIKNSVFGNVGSLAIFRVGADDAEYLQKQLDPVFSAKDIINLDNFNAYLKLLVNGKPVRPFNIQTEKPEKGDRGLAEKIKQFSRLKFGRAREEVEEEIMGKYKR